MDNHKIKIFGKKFVKNNKNRCKIICNSQECGLRTYLSRSDDYTVNDTITIKLTGINNITNMSRMFYKCSSLNFYQIYLNGKCH